MQIPLDRLSGDALQGLLEEFISREGTDYGVKMYSLEDKKRHVMRQIDRGNVVIAFNEESLSCNLLTLEQYQAQQVLEKQQAQQEGQHEDHESLMQAAASAHFDQS